MANQVVESRPPRYTPPSFGELVCFGGCVLIIIGGTIWAIVHFWGQSISDWWNGHWILVVSLILLVALCMTAKRWMSLVWKVYATIDDHLETKEDRRAYRGMITAATVKLQEGYNVDFANSRTGDAIKVVNPYLLPAIRRDMLPAGNVQEINTEKRLEIASPQALPPIPTFAQSVMTGDIYPGQRDILLCHELLRDEETGQIIGMEQRRDKLENNCTMFLGGASKSGKTTLMANLSAQEAMMNALFYVIDPHLNHPEKSIAVKLAPFAKAFILPPAMTDVDIKTVLAHAEAEALARVDGKETRYSGRPIVFLVDESLAVIGRAQRSDNKEIQDLYRALAFFMRDLGTQYNKFDMNGIFASQYVTKDAFKLPGGNVDFRDACQSQALLRLPANQAQAMRLIPTEDLRGIRQLPPGHGYMGFYDGDIIRMASGNITVQDLERIGKMIVPASSGRMFGGFNTPTVPLKEQSAGLENMSSAMSSSKQAAYTLEDGREDAQEGAGRIPLPQNPFELKRLFAEIGKMKAQGVSNDAILKQYGLKPGGRDNMNLKSVVEVIAELDAREMEG